MKWETYSRQYHDDHQIDESSSDTGEQFGVFLYKEASAAIDDRHQGYAIQYGAQHGGEYYGDLKTDSIKSNQTFKIIKN